MVCFALLSIFGRDVAVNLIFRVTQSSEDTTFRTWKAFAMYAILIQLIQNDKKEFTYFGMKMAGKWLKNNEVECWVGNYIYWPRWPLFS